ncbi:hypothetical protein HYH03_010818 [Edaphochlamys debaryana]|uniref:Acyl-coenzyme A oxidase n=1 Tax=Edaphochlamys debaryana TaxID=47281 RepID=A0A835XW38_9CHLO|nr:hypothetical protein HYH03_010818 [Edaphochlamys debaryana]|eukprot:KAG2490905.1 hypothetical protein HYH03_010818 [Edaphochlamys debaryana]
MSTDMASERLAVLSRQLCAGMASSPSTLTVPTSDMRLFLTHDNRELRDRVLDFLKDPIFRPDHYQSLLDFREQTLQRLKKVVGQKFFSVRDYVDNPRKFIASLESLMWADYSLAIKSGVHFTLCGGTIARLGTKYHHDKYLPSIDDLSTPGSYCMTELGHGSNVMGIETTAVYDKAAQCFIINTPNDEASKYWIGGTGQHGKVCVVFAQLTINGTWQGPHVFVVRIRDDSGAIMPGVRIQDQGPKMGLNGVDNGRVWFDNIRVPREDMLDAFSSVSPDGTYTSRINSVSARFGAVVSGLTTGRVLIAAGGVDGAKLALAVAIRYSVQRPQFGDKVIMEYVTQQNRLLPALAQTYAYHLAMGHLKSLMMDKKPADAKAIHILSSGLKAAATWSRVQVMQDCRECCGGMGFLAANKIGPMMNDMNVDVTFEGDNTVMMQQVTRALLDDGKTRLVPSTPTPGTLAAGGCGCAKTIAALLAYREATQLAQVADQMSQAAASAPGTAAAKAAARSQAFERNLDLVLEVGRANIERFCYENFVAETERAPAALKPSLELLANLYGIKCLQKGAAFYLGMGAMDRADVAALRTAAQAHYAMLCAGGLRSPAVALVDAFGIPDHLLQAPIAFDWRKI